MDTVTQEQWEQLTIEAIAVKWLIFIGGGNASKSAVEDVLMLRHGGLERMLAHDVMNHIEYHDTAGSTFRHRRWVQSDPEPAREDWPEIEQVNIKWYR